MSTPTTTITNKMTDWEVVIGLEIHVQLATQSKMFSAAATAFGAEPNSQACAVDLALPGTLPVPNREAINMAIKFGLSTHAEVCKRSVFSRKNYFYPDLPKGYQISQHKWPIVQGGKIDICVEGEKLKTIGITRAHLEEDAGKSIHDLFNHASAIDLNRAGTPLLEIVSEPEMHSAKEAVAYLKTIHTLVQYIGISDGNMQEGSFRCDANVSIRRRGRTTLGTRTEIKNLNSFRFVERAIDYEIQRQINTVTQGGSVRLETRLYDPERNETRAMRAKEEVHNYRYFPDPDLLPVLLDDALIDTIGKQLPELPWDKKARFCEEYNLDDYNARLLTSERALSDYFEAVHQAFPHDTKLIANWINGELAAMLNETNLSISKSKITATALASLLTRLHDQTLSGKIAKQVFEKMWQGEGSTDEIIEKYGLKQITDSAEIEKMVQTVLDQNATQVTQYREGKTQVFGYLVGQVMKATQGKANPKQVNGLLKTLLANS